MEIKNKKQDGLLYKYTVVLEKNDLDLALTQAVESLQGKVKIDGFRKGKIPAEIIQSHYPADVLQKKIQIAVNCAIIDLAAKDKITNTWNAPEVKFLTKDMNSDSLELEIEIESRPEINFDNIENIVVDQVLCDVNDDEVDERIDNLHKFFVEIEDAKPKAALDDKCTIFAGECTISKNGKILREHKADGADKTEYPLFCLSPNAYASCIPAAPKMNEFLMGKTAGDTVKHTFDDGLEICYQITKICKPKLPEAGNFDRIFALFPDINNEKDLKNKVREDIENSLLSRVKMINKEKILKTLLDNIDFLLSDKIIKKEIESLKKDLITAPKEKQKSETEIIAQAHQRIKSALLISELANYWNISVAETELKKLMKAEKRNLSLDKDGFAKYAEKNNLKNKLEYFLLETKITDTALSKIKINEVLMSPKQLEAAY